MVSEEPEMTKGDSVCASSLPHLAVVFGKRGILNIILHAVHCPRDGLERWSKALSSTQGIRE